MSPTEEDIHKFYQDLTRDASSRRVVESKEYDERGLFAVNRFERLPGGVVRVKRTVRRRTSWWSRLSAWLRRVR